MEKYNDTVVIDENTYIEEYLPEDFAGFKQNQIRRK